MPLRIFLGGRFDVDAKVEKAWLKRTGCQYRCFTYANVDSEAKHFHKGIVGALEVCEKRNVGIMFDSGAATIHNLQRLTSKRGAKAAQAALTTEEVGEALFQRYVKYCKLNKDKWAFYVTLDFKKDTSVVWDMQKRFESVGLRPTPVYHGDDGLDWLDKYADAGYKLIGLGTVKSARKKGSTKSFRYYLDKVFNRCQVLNLDLHGLAITGLALMLQYPWWSVDSTTWTKMAGYGKIVFPDFDKGLVYDIHISEKHSTGTAHSYNKMARRHQDLITETIESQGFTLDELRTDVKARHDYNGWVYTHLGSIGLDLNKVRRTSWESLL